MNFKFNHNSLSFFQKNILILFKGTFIAQLIGIVGSIILAKIYGSEAYGIFGVFISVSGILAIFNTLQLDKSIVTVKDPNESKNLLNSLFVISIVLASFLVIIAFLFSKIIVVEQLSYNVLLLTIFASIIFSFNKIHEAYFTFKENFRPISNAKIVVAVCNIVFQLILFESFKLMGLIYGSIISIVIVAIYYFIKNKKYIQKIDLEKLKFSISTNRLIIKYILPSTLINSLAIHLMPLLIVAFFGLKEAGVYFLSLKILATPLFLISSSISQVYYKESSKMLVFSKEKLFGLTKKIVVINLLLMLVILVLINTIGIYFLEFIFKKNWENLRSFTFILSFLILARSSFNPISYIIIVLDKMQISLLFNLYLLATSLFAIFIGVIYNNILHTIIFISVFGGFGYIFLLIYFLKKLRALKN